MSSYVFCNMDIPAAAETFMRELGEWCASTFTQCYVVSKPLIEIKKEYGYNNSCAVLMPKRKLVFLRFDDDENRLEGYAEEFVEDIGYISTKYNYKDRIGRPKHWQRKLVVERAGAQNLSLEEFLQLADLNKNTEDERLSELLVSLVTGSINDINKVGVEVPENDLDRIKRNILLFDGEQTRFVYQDIKSKEVRIQGLSGAGKTELLLHKLKELYLASSDSRIIMTCHNKILAANLRARIPAFFDFMRVEQQIDWNNRLMCAHAWGSANRPSSGAYAAICAFYDVPCYAFSAGNMDFDRACKLSLSAIKEKFGDNHDYAFDYMLIDESQDFADSFFELCNFSTKHNIFIAGDIFQNIFDQRKDAVAKPEFTLSKCYRTAPGTLMFAQALGMGYFENQKLNWLDESDLQACGYLSHRDPATGELVLKREPISRFDDISNENDSVDVIRISGDYRQGCCLLIVEKLKEIQANYPNVQPNDIGIIFVDYGKSVYEISDMLNVMIPRETGWPVNKAFETREPKVDGAIFLSNTNHVKGLEFPFVICVAPHLSAAFAHRNALYMAITRSFLKTYFLVNNTGWYAESIDQIESGLRVIKEQGAIRVVPPPMEEQMRIRAAVKWEGVLQSFDDLAQEIIAECDISGEKAARILKALQQLLDKDAPREKIKELVEKISST